MTQTAFMQKYHLKNIFMVSLYCITLILFNSCARQKTKDEMNFEELKTKALAMVESKRNELAIEYLQQIIARHHEREDINKYKLLLAEIYYKNEHYEAAQELYNHYQQMYPSDIHAEYTRYRSILSQFNQTLRTDCDQEPTKKTINLCLNYLENNPDISYKQDVVDIKKTCEYKLIDKEIYIFNFYLKQKKYDAAEKRLTFLAKNQLIKHPDIAPRLVYLECKLAKKMNKADKVKEHLQELDTQFPESQYTRMAHSMLEKPKFIL